MKDSAVGETGDVNDTMEKQLPKKWNAVVGKGQEESEALLPPSYPVPQPNRRERVRDVAAYIDDSLV